MKFVNKDWKLIAETRGTGSILFPETNFIFVSPILKAEIIKKDDMLWGLESTDLEFTSDALSWPSNGNMLELHIYGTNKKVCIKLTCQQNTCLVKFFLQTFSDV